MSSPFALVLTVVLIGYLAVASPLTYLYLRTGSLLMPILVHALIDLRGLVFTPQPRREPVGNAA